MKIPEQFVLLDVGLFTLYWPTMLFVFAVFLTVVFLLNSLLFRPVLRHLAAREKIIEDNRYQIRLEEKGMHDLKVDYDAKLNELKAELETEKAASIKAAFASCQATIDQAKAESSAKLDREERAVEKKLKEEIAKAEIYAGELAQAIVSSMNR